jgi:hypothetical protein
MFAISFVSKRRAPAHLQESGWQDDLGDYREFSMHYEMYYLSRRFFGLCNDFWVTVKLFYRIEPSGLKVWSSQLPNEFILRLTPISNNDTKSCKIFFLISI